MSLETLQLVCLAKSVFLCHKELYKPVKHVVDPVAGKQRVCTGCVERKRTGCDVWEQCTLLL